MDKEADKARSDRPMGARFTHVYVNRGEPSGDSERMRRRLGSLIDDFRDLGSDFSRAAEREQGIATTWSSHKNWKQLLHEWPLQDVLDLVTIAYRWLLRSEQTRSYQHHEREAFNRWVQEVQRIFAEENVHYEADAKGGVHFRFDAEFATNSAAAIDALRDDRYANVLHAYRGAMDAFGEAPPDGKQAIRSIFSAIEGVFPLDGFQSSAARCGGA